MDGAAMARAGRKRKYPRNIAPAVNYRAMAALQPHRRGLPEAHRLDQKAATRLGCLCLVGMITEAQYLAGLDYAHATGQYLSTVEAPRSLSGSGGGYDCKPDSCPAGSCECLRRVVRYDELYCVLAKAGRRPLIEVNRVAVHNQRSSELEVLRIGLNALARHLRLTNDRKSAYG